MYLGAGVLALEPVGQGREGLERGQGARLRVVAVGSHATALLVDDIDDVQCRMMAEMSRPVQPLGHDHRRVVGREASRVRVKPEL